MEDMVNVSTLDCKQGVVRAVRFNVDGSYCLTCGADKKIKLWNPYRKLMLKIYGGHGDEVLDAAGSCDSSHIVSCSADKSVILWDVPTGQPIRRLRGHAGAICCVRFNEESTMAISGSVDNTVMCWDVKSRKNDPVQILKDAKDCITSVQVTDHEILTSSVDGNIRLYDIRVGKMTYDYMGEVITYVNQTRDGQCFVVSCADDSIRLIDKDSGDLLATYKGHTSKDYSLENSIDCKDSHIISGSATGELFFWDLISGSIVNKLEHSKNKVIASLSYHPVSSYLLSAVNDEVKLWGPPDENIEE